MIVHYCCLRYCSLNYKIVSGKLVIRNVNLDVWKLAPSTQPSDMTVYVLPLAFCDIVHWQYNYSVLYIYYLHDKYMYNIKYINIYKHSYIYLHLYSVFMNTYIYFCILYFRFILQSVSFSAKLNINKCIKQILKIPTSWHIC